MAGEQTQTDTRPPMWIPKLERRPVCQHARAWPSWGSGPSPALTASPLGHPEDHKREGLVDVIAETSQKASFTQLQIAPL